MIIEENQGYKKLQNIGRNKIVLQNYYSKREKDPARLNELLKEKGFEPQIRGMVPYFHIPSHSRVLIKNNLVRYDFYSTRAESDNLEVDFMPRKAVVATKGVYSSNKDLTDKLTEKDSALLEVIKKEYPEVSNLSPAKIIGMGFVTGGAMVATAGTISYVKSNHEFTQGVTGYFSNLSDVGVVATSLVPALLGGILLVGSVIHYMPSLFKKKKTMAK